jgi:WD40 repeat protein
VGAAYTLSGDYAALLIHLPTGKVAHRLAHTDNPNVLRFSPDGRRLAVAAGRCAWLWDVEAPRLMYRFPAFRCYAEAVAFHPSGNFLAVGSREGEVRVWDARDGNQLAAFDWGIGAVHGLAFSPDGMTAAAAGHDGCVMIWDFE